MSDFYWLCGLFAELCVRFFFSSIGFLCEYFSNGMLFSNRRKNMWNTLTFHIFFLLWFLSAINFQRNEKISIIDLPTKTNRKKSRKIIIVLREISTSSWFCFFHFLFCIFIFVVLAFWIRVHVWNRWRCLIYIDYYFPLMLLMFSARCLLLLCLDFASSGMAKKIKRKNE